MLKYISIVLMAIITQFMSMNLVNAATATANMSVTATVASACTVGTTSLSFGNYSSTAETTATATISVNCTNGATYNIGLNEGTGPQASVTNRKMKRSQGSDTLSYSLYQDSAYTTNWGNTPGTNTKSNLTGTGTLENHTVYGKIPVNQNSSTGTYSDTIIVTVNY